MNFRVIYEPQYDVKTRENAEVRQKYLHEHKSKAEPKQY